MISKKKEEGYLAKLEHFQRRRPNPSLSINLRRSRYPRNTFILENVYTSCLSYYCRCPFFLLSSSPFFFLFVVVMEAGLRGSNGRQLQGQPDCVFPQLGTVAESDPSLLHFTRQNIDEVKFCLQYSPC